MSDERRDNILLLRILYGKLIPVMDIYCSAYIKKSAEERQLKAYFKRLIKIIEPVQERLSDKYSFPQLYEDYGLGPDNMQRMWPVYRDEVINLTNKLEVEWRTSGEKQLRPGLLNKETETLLKEIDGIIGIYSKEIKRQQEREKAAEQTEPALKELLTVWPDDSKLTDRTGKVKLEPKSYDPSACVLLLEGKQIKIARQDSKRGTTNETREARLMRLLFKDVNTMQNGIAMRSIVSVKQADFDSKKRKLVKNYIAEINKKVASEFREKDKPELIIFNQSVAMVNSLYL